MKTNLKIDENFRMPQSGSFGRIALIAGIIGLGVSSLGYFLDSSQFFYSYLTAFVFWATVGLGGLFFTMLHHLTGSTWSVVVRRISEAAMVTLPFLLILFIPIILGLQDLYRWSHTDEVAKNAILAKKVGYLNTGFFLIRTVGYFVIWFLLGTSLYRKSLAQDANGVLGLNDKMRRISAPGMILFALTITFASFDWLMSLEAEWYSTIFGVYIFSGSFLAILAFMTLIAQYMRQKNLLADTITVEHYNDLGKLLFAFTVFWAYIAFSQYFLIWYGNIPEETVWFQERWAGNWKLISLILIFGQFVIPFFILMPRGSKRNLKIVKIMSWWILSIHWLDLYWIILPTLHKNGVKLSWMDLSTMIGIGGIFVWLFWSKFSKNPIVPMNDPKLPASIRFENV